MATAGTIVAQLIANTTKFTGPLKKAQRDVQGLRGEITGAGKASTLLGKGLGIRGGLGAIGVTLAAARLIPADVRQAPAAVLDLASEKIAKAFGLVTEKAEEFSKMIDKIGRDFAGGEHKRRLESVAGLRKTQEDLFGRGLKPEDRSLFGGRLGAFGKKSFERRELFRRGIIQAQEEEKRLVKQLRPQALQDQLARLKATALEAARKEHLGGIVPQSKLDEIAARSADTVTKQARFNRRALFEVSKDLAELRRRQRTERGLKIGADVAVGFAKSLRTLPGRLETFPLGDLRQPVNRFRQAALETFENLTNAVRRWKAQVEATADAAREFNRGNIGQFRDAIRLLLAGRLGDEQRRAGLLQAFEELKDKTGLTQIGDATGPLKGSNEALDEILRVTRENPTEKQILDVAEEQLEEQKRIAEKLARELERLGVAGIKQAQF